jgi:hypothetical protein
MSDRCLAVLAAVTLLTTTVPARAPGDVRRETTERRPYIVEIGEPYSITMRAVLHEAANINGLQEYIREYGYPDYAEVQEIAPEWPWESYEVRLYYLRRNLETDFGHVFLSSAMPNYGVLKYQGDIPAAKRHEIDLVLQARQTPPPPAAVAETPPAPSAPEEHDTGGLTEAVVARIEAAAERATRAADRAAEQSEAAARAADRTVNIVEKMVEGAAPRRRRAR